MRRLFYSLTTLFFIFGSLPLKAQLNKDEYYNMARYYIGEGRNDEAISALNSILRIDTTAYEAYFLRGAAKLNLGDDIGADQDITLAVALNPVFTLAYYNRGIARMRLSNFSGAVDDFDMAATLNPEYANLYMQRGVANSQMGAYEAAVADYDNYIRRVPTNTDAYLRRGVSHLSLQDTVRAMGDFTRAIRNNVFDPRGHNLRGMLYRSTGQPELALDDFNKAIELDSTYTQPYSNRGTLYASTDRKGEALADFSKVLELDPLNTRAYFNRALLLSDMGDEDRALSDYDRLLELAPQNIMVYFNRALLKTRMGMIDSAIGDYDKAIEIFPDYVNAYHNRSILREQSGDLRGARADRNMALAKSEEYRSKYDDQSFAVYADTSRMFNRVISFDTRAESIPSGGGSANTVAMMPLFRFSLLYPEDPGAAGIQQMRYYHERVEEFLHDFEQPNMTLTAKDSNISPDSLLMFDRAGQHSGADWKAMFDRAMIQGLVKQYANSIKSYTGAIEENPTNPFLYMNRGAIRSEMVDFVSQMDNSYQSIITEGGASTASSRTYNYEEAIADMNRAIRLLPDFAHLYYNRANLYALSGRMDEACEDYTRAIDLFPAFAEAYFNRGLVQIYNKETRKGILDVSKAGELGIKDAYMVLGRYANDYDY